MKESRKLCTLGLEEEDMISKMPRREFPLTEFRLQQSFHWMALCVFYSKNLQMT